MIKKDELIYKLKFRNSEIDLIIPISNKSYLPKLQRAIGITSGIIKECNKKGNGIIEIDNIEYQLKDNRNIMFKKIFPLKKFINKTISFSYYPTTTLQGIKILKLKPTDKPIIKISNLIKTLKHENYIEIIGNIKYIGKNHFTISIYSKKNKKEYLVNIQGKITNFNLLGYLVKVDCSLKSGLITMDNLIAFPFKKRSKINE